MCNMVPFPMFHLSLLDLGKFGVSFSLCVLVRIAGIAWNFFSMITKLFTNSVTSLTSSRIPSYSKFLVSWWKASCRWIGTFLGACLVGFAFSWAGTCMAHWGTSQFQWKHQSRYQGSLLLSMGLLEAHTSQCCICRNSSGFPWQFLHFCNEMYVHLACLLFPSQWKAVWVPLWEFLGIGWNCCQLPLHNKILWLLGCSIHLLRASLTSYLYW